MGVCSKSEREGAFISTRFVGNAKSPPNVTWTPKEIGQKYYFCDMGTHCSIGKMYGMVNITEPAEAPSSPNMPMEYTVSVGKGGSLVFSPSHLEINLGDKVSFLF